MMVAVPALVDAAKIVIALVLSIVALPAVLVSVPPYVPNRVLPKIICVILALPALLAPRMRGWTDW